MFSRGDISVQHRLIIWCELKFFFGQGPPKLFRILTLLPLLAAAAAAGCCGDDKGGAHRTLGRVMP
jgi:hypothetical protein